MFDFNQKALRPHQERSISLLRQSLSKGHRRPVLQLPTGAGKTLLAANIIRMAREKDRRVAFVVPAISLIDQTVEAFMSEGIHDIGVIQSDHPMQDWSRPVQVCSIQTIARRGFPESDLVIVDECHNQYEATYRWMDVCPEVFFVGLTATPWAKGMGKYWDDLLIGATMRELIEAGYLSDFAVFAPSHPDLTGVRTTAGDYNQKQLGEVMGDGALVADVVDTWLARADGQPTLVFAVDRAHAKKLQTQFERAGVGAGYIDAYTERDERRAIERQLGRGEIRVVCNVGCLTTGVDWDVRCIVLARPTRSEMLFVQMVGRGLRTAEGKRQCVILDHSDNHARLGFVTDIRHDRLNDGEKKKAGEGKEREEPLPKECSKCNFVKPPKVLECPNCGFKPERQSDIEPEEGELVEVKAKKVATMEDKQAFYSGLLAIQRQRGKKQGWVAHTYREKFGVWPRGMYAIEATPSAEVVAFVQHKAIKYAKRRSA
jgi:superfamily II DNA or RNA helicase